jgi:predicted permease
MTPPRLARKLLEHSVPGDESGRSVIGDFDEDFADRALRHGVRRARVWYWRQALLMWMWSAARHPRRSHHYPVGGFMFDSVADLRHAIRVALAAPGQSALIVLTLALAIGTTTIGFAFADTVFLRGLPISNPEDTVIVYAVDARDPQRRTGTFFSDYLVFRERARTVENLSTWTQTRVTLRRSGMDPARVTVSRVTGDLFGVWGLRTQVGRGLHVTDGGPGTAPVAVLSDWYWREAFARSAQVLGSSVIVDAVPHTIVGVLTPDVEFGTFANIAMWVSYPAPSAGTRDLRPTMVTGRLAEGRTPEEAAAELRAIATTLEQEHPESNRGRQALVLQATRAMGGPNLWLVMTLLVGTAALVTVIASVNVAGVLLSRAVARQREFALRVALGARKLRVFRQLVVEGSLLASGAGLGGLLVAEGGLRIVRSVDAEPIFQQIVLDRHEVAFVTALALVSPVIFSLAPALTSLRLNLAAVLNAASTRVAGSGRLVRNALVVAQLALAVALAMVGGLVVRTGGAMLSVPNGFNVNGLVTFTMTFDHLGRGVERRQLAETVERRLREDGFNGGFMNALPGATIETTTLIEPNGIPATSGIADAWAHTIEISHSVLETLHVPMIAGRGFSASDVASDADIALISAEAARRYFGGVDNAIGRALAVRQGGVRRVYQIAGVTADVRNSDPERGMPPRVWIPMAAPFTATFVVRGAADVATTSEIIRQIARKSAPGVPVESLETYSRAIGRLQGGDRVAMGMLIAFAAVAILFAAIGLYGTVALSTSLRRGEFATRYALGARPSDVAGLVLRQAFTLLLMGLVPGIALGVLAAIGMRRLLFGVSPIDPLNLAGVATMLTLITLAASLAPAIRAARIDLMAVLRRP